MASKIRGATNLFFERVQTGLVKECKAAGLAAHDRARQGAKI
jgi:hypothetical protein